MKAESQKITARRIWAAESGEPAGTPRAVYVFARLPGIPKIVFASFLLFVVALPFEATDVGFASGSLSVAKISGVVFLAAYFFYYNPVSEKRRLPPVPAAMWWFLGYVAVYAGNGFFLSPDLLRPFVNLLGTLLQLVLIFWIASSLLQNERVTKATLLTFGLGSVALAVGVLIGLPGFSTVIETEAGERITSLGFNANVLGTTMALAAIGLIGLRLDLRIQHRWSKFFLTSLLAPLLALIVRTGSRAAIGALVIGFMVFLLPARRSRSKAPAFILVALGIGFLAYMVATTSTVLTRLEETYEGKLNDREKITLAALEMVSQKPIFGWQPVEFWRELGRRVGHIGGTRDAHNLFLHLLLESGVVGAVPFGIGLWLCARSAWRGRRGPLGTIALALLVAMMTANLTHTYLTRKPLWLILALSLAAGTAANKQRGAHPAALIHLPLRNRA